MQKKTMTYIIFLCIILFCTISNKIKASIKNDESETKFPSVSCPQNDLRKIAMQGNNLNQKEADNLEEHLSKEPNDLVSRTKLLGFYFLKRYKSDKAKDKYSQHVFWMIENKPDSDISGTPYTELNPVIDGQAYFHATELWQKQINNDPNNTAILGYAANFFLLHDSNLAEDLLKKAQSIEPQNPQWPQSLSHLYTIRNISAFSSESAGDPKKSLEQMEKAADLTLSELDRFYMLPYLAKAAFKAGDPNKAQTYANELFSIAPKYPNDWNYGNAIHHANIILGRIALTKGDIESAKNYLIEAGKTPGSPQLNSFGPNMTLAKELLEKKEKQTVLKYFEQCKKFWKSGRKQLYEWTALVKTGQIPNFGANLAY